MVTKKSIYKNFTNGAQLFLNRAFFRNTGPTIYEYKGLTFLVDHKSGDQDGPRSCVSPGLYDPFFDVIEGDEPLNFIDMGANAGGFVLALLKNRRTVAKGVAVELNPVTWSRLVYNVFANVPDAYGKMQLLNGAVAAAEGTIGIRLGNGSVGDNINGLPDGTFYQLPCHTIESLIERFQGSEIDILKIDIEGSEYDLLDTPPDVLKSVRYILIEIHESSRGDEEDVINWIRNAGFSIKKPSRQPIEHNVFLFQRD